MKILNNLLYLLTKSERKKASLLLLMISIMALLDMIGIASILPFMAVLTNPDVVETNLLLNTMFQKAEIFGIFTIDSFLFGLGVIVFILLVASLAFKAITMYWQNRFVQMRNFSISKRLLEGYLHQPYTWFLSRHSADLGKNILSEVGIVVSSGVKPMLDLIAQSLVTFAILALLIFVDPILTVVVSLTLGISYGLIYKILRNFINKIGEERLVANKERFTVVSEVLGAVKAVKVSGLENEYVSRFIQPAQTFARHIASAAVLIILPRYALEAIAFGGMLLIILYLMSISGDFNSIIPIAALYAFAGYRLMPALQQIYGAISQLRFVRPSLDTLKDDIKGLSNNYTNNNQEILNFKKTINLKNINFSYPNTSEKVLKNINFTIPALSTIGLVGETGSGKTTIIDIILGLLDPVEGKLEIDNTEINKLNKRSWQNIGYVPRIYTLLMTPLLPTSLLVWN